MSERLPEPGRSGGGGGGRGDWRWPVVVLAGMALCGLAWQATWLRIERAPAAALDGLGSIAERFRSGRITTTFTAALPRLETGGARLELVAFEATERVRREDDRSVFFDLVSLGTTVSEIQVPVTYRYHLRLDEPWQLDVRDRSCLVRAPRIHPTLPPAIHTDGMTRRSETGWLRFDGREQMDALEQALTPILSQRALAPETLASVRETCRRRVAEFVRDWLLREEQWRDDRFGAIHVEFADEVGGPERPPTLTIEKSR